MGLGLFLDYYRYQLKRPSIERNLRSKEKLRVIFFVINLGMWKSDELFCYLQKDSRFDPYIMSFLLPSDSEEYKRNNQEEMKDYFNKRNFPFIEMYSFENDKWFDIESFNPDIIFYAQPYDIGYDRYRTKSLWNNSLFYYIPYCIDMEVNDNFMNNLQYNICKKVFAPTEFHLSFWKRMLLNGGKNIILAGYPTLHKLTQKGLSIENVWKINSKELKRIIWAPHHSIRQNDALNYSNFLSICDDMIAIAEKYDSKMQFCFKPHPRLRSNLEEVWGIKKTNDYYDKWKMMNNTTFIDGDYLSLFSSSDGLIHDCSTFLAEYLCTGNPPFFVMKRENTMPLNEFGQQCLALHYQGTTVDDIECYLQNQILLSQDLMRENRCSFVKKYLVINNNSLSPAEIIYNEMNNDLF